jgi:drug/metabolite transporter (DMT)-like permease
MREDPSQPSTDSSGVIVALLSALLFGITTPVAKQLVSGMNPLLLAGLLYLGSGLGLALLRALQDRGWSPTYLSRADGGWLAAATLVGGVVAPALLMTGLQTADASTASLLLNLEVVFTAAIAWIVFREPTSRRLIAGLLAIFAGGLVLVWPDRLAPRASMLPLAAITGACLCWAIDNNLTRKISAGDARAIAMVKGLVAGLTNTSLVLAFGISLPTVPQALGSVTLGFLGYGLSLMLFILALRQLGTARTSAYFATAPFIGAAVAMVFYDGQPSDVRFWLAALCMGVGVWLHVTESHDHVHQHEEMSHTHSHVHDEHHQHEHGFDWDGAEPHAHEHRHEEMEHSHAHLPDIHHQHEH